MTRNIQGGSLLQDRLGLGAVFADDAEIIPPGFAGPAFRILPVQGTELAEGIGGEEDFIRPVIGHEHFGPVNHGGGNELQGMGAQGELRSLGSHDPAVGILLSVEILHHGEGLGGGDDDSRGIFIHEAGNIGGMIRLHMLDHEVIRKAAGEGFLQAGQPFLAKVLIHRVHDGDFFVQDHVGIIGHAVGDDVLPLKKIEIVIIYTDVNNIICNPVHLNALLFMLNWGNPDEYSTIEGQDAQGRSLVRRIQKW